MVLVATQVKRRRGTTAENDAFTGAEGEITVDTEKHELRVHDGVTQGGFKIGGGSGSGRNTGDTFLTKRTDTNLAGAVECDGATYNTTDFTGDGSIGELLEAGKLDYISLSAYSTAIAQTGWCDKIGWDGAGNTAFRVPTINPRHYIIKTQEPTAENNYTWYKLYADGWVEQGSDTSNSGQTVTVNMPVEMADTRYTVILTLNHDNTNAIYPRTVATKSTTSFVSKSYNDRPFNWVVSGMSNITPESASRVMIQIANGATDQALETCTGVLADVAGLKDMSNVTADGKEVIAHQAMPSNRYINLTLGASGATYTAPANGWFFAGGVSTGAWMKMTCNNMSVINYIPNGNGSYVSIQAKKGAVMTLEYSQTNITDFKFVYAEGEANV